MMQFQVSGKREAGKTMQQMLDEHGGIWFVEKVRGSEYCVRQEVTREAKARMEERNRAEFILSDKCDWFGNGVFFGARKELDRLEEKLAKFRTEFEKDPFYALERATDTCQVAADHKVLSQIIAHYDAGREPEAICQWLESDAQHNTEFESLSNSTSPMPNLMAAAKRIATNKYARSLRGWITQRSQALGTLYEL